MSEFLFSPHTRGCSLHCAFPQLKPDVFPAYAGMFPARSWRLCWRSRFPRIRGDVPNISGEFSIGHGFSPHTRGCSLNPRPRQSEMMVFPAYAGMFPWESSLNATPVSFPRIRGDVPTANNTATTVSEFSPHTRGCSGGTQPFRQHRGVFPAYTGMFRKRSSCLSNSSSFPRIRGDVPCWCSRIPGVSWFSPHTRGCSHTSHHVMLTYHVFPAYAGMFLTELLPPIVELSFPRIRGDVPQ